jgi:hypothetical protein
VNDFFCCIQEIVAAAWFRSCIENKKMKNHAMQPKIPTQAGEQTVKHLVSKWSILRPLFFLIYINDISSTINAFS